MTFTPSQPYVDRETLTHTRLNGSFQEVGDYIDTAALTQSPGVTQTIIPTTAAAVPLTVQAHSAAATLATTFAVNDATGTTTLKIGREGTIRSYPLNALIASFQAFETPSDTSPALQIDYGGVRLGLGGTAPIDMSLVRETAFSRSRLYVDAPVRVSWAPDNNIGVGVTTSTIHSQTFVNRTNTVQGDNNLGINSGVQIGDATHPAIGTAHTFTGSLTVTNGGAASNEYAAYFGGLRHDGGTPGRFWLTDFNVHSGIGVRQDLMAGVTQFMNQHYNGTPTHSLAVAFSAQTFPGYGGGKDSAHATATTYPVDVGFWVSGASGAPGGGANTQGFRTGFKVGQGSLSEAAPWGYPWSHIGTGLLVDDYVTDAIKINSKSTIAGTNYRAINVTSGAGIAALRDGVVTRTKAGTPVDGDFPSGVLENGIIVVDTTASKIWVRFGTANWKSVTLA